MSDQRSRFQRRSLAIVVAAALTGCAATADKPSPEVGDDATDAAQSAPAPEPVSSRAYAEPEKPLLRDGHPRRYVVEEGDTLWDIAASFLNDPWRWPEIWQINPVIDNPHLIFPGDTLHLVYVDGKPRIQVQRGYPTVKLSPHARVEPLDRAIPTIPVDVVAPFLNRARVVGPGELEEAPYILASADEHLVVGPGDRVYVRGLTQNGTPDGTNFAVLRGGEPYLNPDDPEDVLGYRAIHVADAQATRFGEPATLKIVSATREVLNGDRVLPVEERRIQQNFLPHVPSADVEGKIIYVLDGVTQIGQYQTVVLSLGAEDGMETGHVLAVYQTGETVRDVRDDYEEVKLPNERAGVVMVYRVFDRVSYALVMQATRPMHTLDTVVKP